MPQVDPDDLLIRVDRTGICGTDAHIYAWDAWAQSTIGVPMVVGHEFVGEVVEAGSHVKDFSLGMLVSAEGHVVCGLDTNWTAYAACRIHLMTKGLAPQKFTKTPFTCAFPNHSSSC